MSHTGDLLLRKTDEHLPLTLTVTLTNAATWRQMWNVKDQKEEHHVSAEQSEASGGLCPGSVHVTVQKNAAQTEKKFVLDMYQMRICVQL